MEDFKKRILADLSKNSKGRKRKGKDEKETELSKDEQFREAIEAIPEELKDSGFVTAYVKRRIIQRNKRESAKAERERAQAAINKMKKISDAPDKVLLGAWRSKDFIYNYWELKTGKIYREVIARPGLRLTN